MDSPQLQFLEQEQFERDCKAQCWRCALGRAVKLSVSVRTDPPTYAYEHELNGYAMPCNASDIRTAWDKTRPVKTVR